MKLRYVAALVLFFSGLLLCPEARAAADFYAIHVSSHRDAREAAAEAARFRGLGQSAFSRAEIVTGKGTWHRVYLGNYPSAKAAEEAAYRLKAEGLIENARITAITAERVVPDTAPPPAKAPERSPDGTVYTPFKKLVYGRFVATFRYKHLADAEAEGLTANGWPARVSEEMVQGVPWFRVYLLPPGGRSVAGLPSGQDIQGFDLIADMSEAYPEIEGARPPYDPTPNLIASGCQGYTRHQARMIFLRKFNAAVPNQTFLAALRNLGYRRLDSTEDHFDFMRKLLDKGPETKDFTYRLWGVQTYDRTEYGDAIGRLQPSDRNAPKAPAIAVSRQELDAIPGRKALIVFSDFQHKWGDEPVPEAAKLKERYGAELCIYTIYLDADEKGRQTAREVALAGQCGNVYDGCRSLSDQAYFDQMIREIFYGVPSIIAPVACAADEDGDGVCDDRDQCPDTPQGALVDQRGCWIAALDAFFDFDSAVVKEAYFPGIQWAADVLKDNPALVVEVQGHTDSVGSHEYNIDLGRRRAEAVKVLLVRFGVPADRLRTNSYGETRPAKDNSTAAGRAGNRRVELQVIR